MITIMARKNYTAEFRQQAVDLYESSPEATLKQIAKDLGVSRGTLSLWVKDLGSGVRDTNVNPTTMLGGGALAGESVEVRVARLEAENARLRADKTRIQTERDILRKAAKYFAGETNW